MIRGYKVKHKKSPIYFSVAACYFAFYHTDAWRVAELKSQVRLLADHEVRGYDRVWSEDCPASLEEAEEEVIVPSHESTGLGFYRGYSQIESGYAVTHRAAADLRFRQPFFVSTVKEFECGAPVRWSCL